MTDQLRVESIEDEPPLAPGGQQAPADGERAAAVRGESKSERAASGKAPGAPQPTLTAQEQQQALQARAQRYAATQKEKQGAALEQTF